jgi:hypothetical protein
VHAILRRRAPVAATFLPCLLLAASARAQVEPIRLVYRSYAGCPSESHFVREVTANVEHARPALGDEVARTFLVGTSPEGTKSRGFLQIIGTDGVVSRREVTGDTCEEVVSALALMITLAIDPITELPASPSRLDAGTRLDAGVTASPGALNPWHWGAGIDGQLLAGFVPGWAPGGGAFVDLASPASGALAPSFRVTLLGATADPTFIGGVGARITWLTARAEGCPGRLSVGSLSVTACLDLDAGVLLSEGTGLTSAASKQRPWIVPGALGRVSWPSREGPWVEGTAGIAFPLERYSFYYQHSPAPGASEVSRVAPVGAELGLGAGYRFP